MMTPQEVASHAFSKASFGGYNMSMVDEFLDLLTEDYTALYNDNAILKNKLKILSDTVEEYRATDDAMRKTLLSAQKMAESMVKEAEQKKADLVKDAEAAAAQRIGELRQSIADEEFRLKSAREATATHVQQLKAVLADELTYIDKLSALSAPVQQPDRVEGAAADIEASVQTAVEKEIPQSAPEKASETAAAPEVEDDTVEFKPASASADADDEPTRVVHHFGDLQFGKDYEIQ